MCSQIHCCSCLVAKSCLTLLGPHGSQPARLLHPRDSSGKNTEVGCHFLLQGIFSIQGSNPYLLCFLPSQAGSLPLCHLKSLLGDNMGLKPSSGCSKGLSLPWRQEKNEKRWMWKKELLWSWGWEAISSEMAELSPESELCVLRVCMCVCMRVLGCVGAWRAEDNGVTRKMCLVS